MKLLSSIAAFLLIDLYTILSPVQTKGHHPDELLPPSGEATLTLFRQALRLKRLYRQGWLKRGIGENECESVADHSFGVALLALTAPLPDGDPVDRRQAVLLALIHELGEIHAGDITPVDGINKDEKTRMERESMEKTVIGHPDAAGLRALWEEFEAGVSAEARFVRQLDRLEMGIQADVYRAEGHPRMEEFLETADRAVRDPALRRLLP